MESEAWCQPAYAIMQNPYEVNSEPEERSGSGVGCALFVSIGFAVLLVILVVGGIFVYRLQVRSAVMQEEAMRARAEAFQAQAEAERARREAIEETPSEGAEATSN